MIQSFYFSNFAEPIKMVQYWSLNPSKNYGDKFFIYYAGLWIPALAIIIYTNFYENASKLKWFLIGLAFELPCWFIPILFPSDYDKLLPITKRYWFKANLWNAIFGFIGNYFWTHYFYKLLGARYELDTYELNGVPIVMYFITQAYFTFYHSLMNVIQRIFLSKFSYDKTFNKVLYWLLIITLSYIIAFFETWSIQYFPYYTFVNRQQMYSVGSIFYALCFLVSFPLYIRMDETISSSWSLREVCMESLGCGMLVLILMDFWKLMIGNINDSSVYQGLPFLFK